MSSRKTSRPGSGRSDRSLVAELLTTRSSIHPTSRPNRWIALLGRGVLDIEEATLLENEQLAEEVGVDLSAYLLGCVAPSSYLVACAGGEL